MLGWFSKALIASSPFLPTKIWSTVPTCQKLFIRLVVGTARISTLRKQNADCMTEKQSILKGSQQTRPQGLFRGLGGPKPGKRPWGRGWDHKYLSCICYRRPRHVNRPFPSSLVPLFQGESKCETNLMKMTLIYMKMKLHVELIFIWKVSHLDSFWNRGTRELGNGLLQFPMEV